VNTRNKKVLPIAQAMHRSAGTSRERFGPIGFWTAAATGTGSLSEVGVELGSQAIAVLIENEVHASLGAARSFVKAAAGLLLFVRCRAEGNVLGLAEVHHRPADHTGLPFPPASRGE